MAILSVSCTYCGSPLKRNSWFESKMFFCNKQCKGEWQRLQKPVTKEWLIQKYAIDGLDCTQIALLVGRDSKRVWEWLQDYGIETRKRGTTGNWKYSIGIERNLTEEGRKKLSDQARQARLKDRRIPAFVNGVHWMRAYPEREHPHWKGGLTPERQRFYASEEWRETVKIIWERDAATCQRCMTYFSDTDRKRAFHIHHIDSFAIVESRTIRENLVLLCHSCHMWVHSKRNVHHEWIGLGHSAGNQ